MNRSFLLVVAASLSALVLSACSHNGGKGTFVPGTRIPFSQANKAVLDTAEEYRLAVERADTEALMMMVHKQYWEDSGTPSGSDDYGYEGVRAVLDTRLTKATDIRYSIRYLAVRQSCTGDLIPGCRAAIDIMIDASFTIANAFGKTTRPDKRDQNQLTLEWDGRRWLFLSGM